MSLRGGGTRTSQPSADSSLKADALPFPSKLLTFTGAISCYSPTESSTLLIDRKREAAICECLINSMSALS